MDIEHLSQTKKSRDPNSTICPKCNSNDTRSLQMIHEDGTSKSVGTISGVALGDDGGIGFGVANTQSTTKTNLAERAAPPEKPELNLILTVALMTVFVIIGLTFFSGLMILLVVPLGIILSIALGYFTQRPSFKNKMAEYEKDLAGWKRTWMCLKCGGAFRRLNR